MKPLVKLNDISVYREGTYILQDISLEVNPANIISIIGPNGGGKTTLARILAGIIKPQAGSITRAEKLRTGYVPQYSEADYLMPLSVDFFLRLSPYYTANKADEVIEELNISPLLDKQFNSLSGGQKQRVLLARAIWSKPQLMILDEPTQALDIEGSINFYEMLSSYKPDCAIVLISHDLNFVMSKTEKVICLNTHICCQGAPKEINANPAYQQLFGKRVTQNLALYSHRHNHSHK